MKYVTAREIMTTPVITVRPTTPIRDIAALMLHSEVSGLPVVDNEMHLLGLVTEDDLLRREEAPLAQRSVLSERARPLWLERLLEQYQAAEAATAQQLMTAYVETADEDTPARDLARLMLNRKLNRVLILRNGRLVGIVTRADVLKVFVRSDQALVDAVRDTLRHDLDLDPALLTITCKNGVVTLAGEVARHSQRALAIKWLRTIDGIVGVDADALTYRVDDLALGQVVR